MVGVLGHNVRLYDTMIYVIIMNMYHSIIQTA